MDNENFEKEIQDLIDSEFKKILKIKIDDRHFKIAITRDEVPSVKKISFKENSFLITFDDYYKNKLGEKDFDIVRNQNQDIIAVSIKNISKLKSSSYLTKVRRELLNDIKNFPESNSNEIIKKHKQKRTIHAISEILKTVPENLNSK
jgi:hypothetical protein